MSEDEQKLIESLCSTLPLLPESKREWLMGFGEGMAFMKELDESRCTTEECQK